jgi:hypothetical protein
MPLPPPAPNGYLPVGVHLGTLSEIEARFAVTPDRKDLMRLLTNLVAVLASFPSVKRILVDGCFIGPRTATKDIEVVALMMPPEDPSADEELAGRMRALRKAYNPAVELLWFPDGSAKANILVDFFQEDKPEHGGEPKGIVELVGFR